MISDLEKNQRVNQKLRSLAKTKVKLNNLKKRNPAQPQ